MNKKKILLAIIVSIFLVGMIIGTASASHTFKDKGYKYKISDSEYNKMKKNAKKQAKKMSKILGHPTSAYDHKMVKVSKKSKVYIAKNGKLNKKYPKQTINKIKKGWKYIKTVGNRKTGYQIYKKTAHMNCKVEYYKGRYMSYGVVF